MNRRELYLAWAPQESPWSPWVKPVGFDYERIPPPSETPRAEPAILYPGGKFDSGTAVIVDLRGIDSARMGVYLAEIGWRPVPVFTAAPVFGGIIDAISLVCELREGWERLARLSIAPAAPPAFLMDSDRNQKHPGPSTQYLFDNRAPLFSSDLPSGSFLKSRGIGRVIIVQERVAPPAQDILFILHYWKEEGIEISAVTVAGEEVRIHWPRFRYLRELWHLFRYQFRPSSGSAATG